MFSHKGNELHTEIKKMIENGKALQCAIKMNNLQLVKMLVQKGAKINVKPSNGDYPILLAVFNEFWTIFDFLVKNGADLNVKSSSGYYLLHHLVFSDNVNMIRYVLDFPIDVNVKAEESHQTPLLLAVKYRDKEIVRALLENGGNLNSTNITGCNPLITAINDNRIEIVELLLEFGANVNQRNPLSNLAPIHYSVREGFVEITELLLVNGANANAQEPNGVTPIIIASHRGNFAITKLLIDYDANVNVTYGDFQTNFAVTSLHNAVMKQHDETVDLLIKSGANINARTNTKVTPILIAAGTNSAKNLNLLLQYGADKDIRDVTGMTPFEYSLREKYLGIMKMIWHRQ